MEIEKSYFTLPEILERWSMSEADLVYLAENDQLRLSIRVSTSVIRRRALSGLGMTPRFLVTLRIERWKA